MQIMSYVVSLATIPCVIGVVRPVGLPCVGQILCWRAINTGGQSYPNALKVRITDQAYTSQPEMSGASAPPNISMQQHAPLEMYFTNRHSQHNCGGAITFALGMHYVHYIINFNCKPPYVVCYIFFMIPRRTNHCVLPCTFPPQTWVSLLAM